MLLSMLRRRTALRVMIALIAVLAVVIAGPLHAAHHHDDSRLHALFMAMCTAQEARVDA